MTFSFWKAAIAGAAVIAATAYALAQMPAHNPAQAGHEHRQMMGPMHERMMQMQTGQQGMHQGMGQHSMMGQHGMMSAGPSMPGQDAFGTIQEIVQMLEADPATDWSKVKIAALREHLIDMNEMTLHAAPAERALDNGVEIAVTGDGRTREAIKRMVPAHARELVKLGYDAKTEDLHDGVKLTVVSNDAKQAVKLKALGFMGIMVLGPHHQPHHLMMAKGEFQMH
jgi:hypothetical protein